MNIDKDLLLVLKSSGLGEGEPDLGLKLIGSFLDMLLETGNVPSKIICINSGIFLTTAGTPVEKQMEKFAEAGTEILSCATCLNYYKRKDMLIIGGPTTMRDIVKTMLEHKKVLCP